jgi:hypothetical protein
MSITLIKDKRQPYQIKREGKPYWVIPTGKPNSDKVKVMPFVGGGAGAQATPAAVLASYLSVAAHRPMSIQGSVPTGLAGGAGSNVTWQQDIPTVPAFCTAIDYLITMPVTLTLPATTGTATVSPYAPYSAISNQLTLGGAPPWPLTEMTPWYLDNILHKTNYDENYVGLGNDSGYFSAIIDQGPSPTVIGGTGSIAPGATVTNVTGGPVSTNYTFTFKVRIQLQRKRQLLWGAVPFGDPENRPMNLTQINQLIGINPERSLFVNASNAATCVLNGAATVTATYELSYIDLLPPTIASVPLPSVAYGLQLVQSSTTGMNAGIVVPIYHRTAMLYTGIHHLLVNGQLPLQADYFGLWDDNDQQSSRWAYDAQVNTFQQYFDKFKRTYRRYPNKGWYVGDLEGGVYPEVPSLTPYDALMSPDASYAAAFGIPATPAMTTAVRFPSATTMSQPYVRNYDIGLISVPY